MNQVCPAQCEKLSTVQANEKNAKLIKVSNDDVIINNYLEMFSRNNNNDFSFLHLNLGNDIKNNINEVDNILNTKYFDLVMFQETHLDENDPISFYKNNIYRYG